MNAASVERLENNFRLITPRGEELVDRFYATLFSRQPAVRGMFPGDMSEQKKKLLSSIALVMKNLRAPDALRQPLMDLGRRHSGYGVKPEHYAVVRDTLIEVLAELSGQSWSSQLTADWTEALNFVAETMQAGQAAAPATTKQ